MEYEQIHLDPCYRTGDPVKGKLLKDLLPKTDEELDALKEMGVSLTISEDKMQLFALLKKTILADKLIELVRKIGIIGELQPDMLRDKRVQFKHIKAKKPILLADLSESLLPGYEIDFRLPETEIIHTYLGKLHGQDEEESTLEDELPLINIRKGTLIGRRLDEEEVKTQSRTTNLYGVDVYRPTIFFKLGKLTEENEEREIVASEDGQLLVSLKSVEVHDTYEIKDLDDWDVGATLKFIGTVKIGQNIIEHFDIEAGKAITINGSSEVANLTAGTEILVKEGIVGQGEAKIRARDLVKAQYINQAEVFCEQNCEFSAGSFHSDVECHGKLSVEKGPIIGGHNYGANGIVVKHLGGVSGVITRVSAGFNEDVALRLDNVRHQIKAGKERMGAIMKNLKVFTMNPQKLAYLSSKEKEELRESNEKLKDLKIDLKKKIAWMEAHDIQLVENAKITVTGIIYPGTHIKINNYALEIKTEMKRHSFRADQDAGCIVMSPL